MAFVQGENHWDGAEMARDEINKAGGINVGGKRMQVELVRADTNEIQSVPDATNAIERAITRDKADFLIGGFRSEAVLAMQEVAMDYKKLFLGAGAAHSKLGANVEANYDRYKYWFRVTPVKDVDLARSVFAVLGTVAQQIRTELKADTPKIAILAEKAVWTEALVAAAQKNIPADEDGSRGHRGSPRPSPPTSPPSSRRSTAPARTWCSPCCRARSASRSAGRWASAT